MSWLRQKLRLLWVLIKVSALTTALKKGRVEMDMIMGVLRAILAAVGGWMINKGYADSALIEGAIGAILTLVTAIWSIISKKKAAQAIAAAKAATVDLRPAE